MEDYIFAMIIAICYAVNRAFNDSYLREGGWKLYSTIEAFWLSILITGLIVDFDFLKWITMSAIFGLTFSLFFDMIVGKLFGGSFFYLGSGKWDTLIKQIFWNGKLWAFCKLVGIVGFTGLYFEILNS